VISVRRADPHDVEACASVLAGLPDHFTPDTHDEVRRAWPHHPAWVAVAHDRVTGFVLAERRYPTSAEITFAAVEPARHGEGIGTALVDAALSGLAEEGVRLVEVKTLDASAGYEPYVATRGFWQAQGFVQVDCIDPLPGWQPGNPAAVYVAALTATR
jgi:ribosomal protein S18 acetylase RimI-like enzyme